MECVCLWKTHVYVAHAMFVIYAVCKFDAMLTGVHVIISLNLETLLCCTSLPNNSIIESTAYTPRGSKYLNLFVPLSGVGVIVSTVQLLLWVTFLHKNFPLHYVSAWATFELIFKVAIAVVCMISSGLFHLRLYVCVGGVGVWEWLLHQSKDDRQMKSIVGEGWLTQLGWAIKWYIIWSTPALCPCKDFASV